LQRRLRIGYGRASRIIDEMEERGVIGPADGSRPREVLVRSMDEVFGDDSDDDTTQIPVSDDPRDEYIT
jgi:S-DNA-T family DNA segregation ATPase FtsK/SpoIIIE